MSKSAPELIVTSIRIEPHLRDWIKSFAEKKGASFSSFNRYVLNQVKEKIEECGKKEILIEL